MCPANCLQKMAKFGPVTCQPIALPSIRLILDFNVAWGSTKSERIMRKRFWGTWRLLGVTENQHVHLQSSLAFHITPRENGPSNPRISWLAKTSIQEVRDLSEKAARSGEYSEIYNRRDGHLNCHLCCTDDRLCGRVSPRTYQKIAFNFPI